MFDWQTVIKTSLGGAHVEKTNGKSDGKKSCPKGKVDILLMYVSIKFTFPFCCVVINAVSCCKTTISPF